MAEEITLKYKWRKTWPDVENDFSGSDGDINLGRFYKHQAPDGERWHWFFSWSDHGDQITLSGLCLTPREAAQEIERAYEWVRSDG